MARKLVANQDNTSTSSQTEPLTREVARPIFGENVLAIDYNFAEKGILDDDITFSRASGATQRNSEGKICYAPHNYYVYSENFGHSDWSKQSLTITADTSVTDPFGGTGSFKAVKQGSLNHQRLYDGVARSGGAGETYTLSVYVKPTTNLIGLAITFVGADDVNKNITVTPNVWQRVSFSVTTTGSYSSIVPWIYPCGSSGDDDNSSGGDAHIFGAQFESNFLTTPTDYNKTDGAAYNGPRLDFDHAASLSKDITESNRLGLLVEEQKTNLQANSSQWVVASHAINNFNAVTNNFAISPSGARDAWRAECYDTGGAARHEFYTRYNKANATRYTHSLYIKPFGTVTHLKGSDEGSSSRAACFDLINCQVVSNGLSNEGATIEKITEDGWVRVSFTFVSVAATADSYLYWAVGDEASLVSGNSVFANYDPGKGQGVFVWGVQQEVQNLSSYIPTYGSTSVRSGDSAVVSGTNFSRSYKDGKGESWIVDAEDYEVQRTTSQQAAVIKVHEGGNTFLGFGKGFGGGVLNRPAVWYKDGISGGDMVYNSNFGNQQQTIDKNASYKLGVALDVDDAAWIMNGHLLGSAQKDTSVPSLYSPTELRIGTSASHEYNGHIRRVRYYTKRISDAQLVKKTNTDFLLNKHQHVKAAHSLRQLKEENTNSPVTRIRREYDSFEADYTAAQVSNGELENDFKSEKQTTLPLDVSVEADELVTNGGFDSNTGWTFGSTWSIANGVATWDDTAVGSMNTTVALKKGKTYTLTFEVVAGTTPYIWLGNSAGSYSYDGRAYATRNIGHHTETFTMTSDQTTLAFYGSTSGTTFSIDNVSLKEVNPKATGYSCRKINSDYTGYGPMRIRNNDDQVEAELGWDSNNEISLDSPVKATSMNLMPISENFAQVNMNASATVEGGQSDPFGGNNAYKLKATSTNYSGITPEITGITAGDYYTISAYMKAGTSTLSRIGIYDNNTNPFWINVDVAWSASGVPSTSASVGASNINYEEIGTDGWYRVSFTGQALATDGNQYLQIHADRNATAKNVLIYGIQLEETVYEDTPSGSELVTNGTFDTDGSTWGGDSSSGWYNITSPSFTSIVNGEAILDGSQGTSDARQHVDVTPGKTYQISVDMRTDSTSGSGSARFYMSDGANYSYAFGSFNATNTMTTYSKLVRPTQNQIRLYAYNTKDDKAYYDNISVKEISPLSPKEYTQTPVVSDAHNSTSATNLREFCGKENLLEYSEAISTNWNQYGWGGSSVNYTTGQTDPNGGTGATKIELTNADTSTGGRLITEEFSAIQNQVYVLSVFLKGENGGEQVQIDFRNSSSQGFGGSTVTLTTEWVRYSVVATSDATALRGLQLRHTGTQSDQTYYFFGGQVNTNSLKDYVATTGTAKTADVHCVVWYDQGMGEDATQSTAGNQPRIVKGAELVTDSGGKAALDFDADHDNLYIDQLAGHQRLDAYYVVDPNVTKYSLASSYSSPTAYFLLAEDGSSVASRLSSGEPNYFVNGSSQSGTRNDFHDALDGANKVVGVTNIDTSSWVNFQVGEYWTTGSADYSFGGKISEMVFFPNMDSSPKRFPIEQNMMSAFNVPYHTLDFENFTASELGDNSVMGPSGSSTLGTATLSAETANPISGTQSMKIVTTSGNNSSYPRIYFANKAKLPRHPKIGEKYRLTFDTKLISGNITIRNISFRDGSDAPPAFLKFSDDELVLSGTQTHTYETTITDLTSITRSVFWSIKGTTSAGTFLLDNIKIEKIGEAGYVTTLYDQTGNNCHALQATAANQPQIVSGGDLIKSGNHPAWYYNVNNPQRNLAVQGMENLTTLDAFFVHETGSDQQFIYPSSNNSSYFGFIAHNGNATASTTVNYGSPILEVNGVEKSPSDRDDVYDEIAGRKLVYHRSASTTTWTGFNVGFFDSSSNNSWNLEDIKFSEMVFWDSDQHSNQSGIESNINTHYNIY